MLKRTRYRTVHRPRRAHLKVNHGNTRFTHDENFDAVETSAKKYHAQRTPSWRKRNIESRHRRRADDLPILFLPYNKVDRPKGCKCLRECMTQDETGTTFVAIARSDDFDGSKFLFNEDTIFFLLYHTKRRTCVSRVTEFFNLIHDMADFTKFLRFSTQRSPLI